ncbi:hypothetical protein [Nocardia wallacei]|uniref:hypothetical protein n=1 Tax=Nocardia wallacei TaxID=480035 RepID=UPI002454D8F9|nr:hypothetical protein [Nocardia wallacei]
MTAKPLPATVTGPLIQLLGWLAWLVLLLCIARAIWVAGLLAVRLYRDEAVEGLAAALSGAVLIGSASGIAAALIPTR